MSDLSLFFAGNAVAAETEEFAASDRFVQRDDKGNPVLDEQGKPKPVMWQLKAIPEEENEAIRASATRKVKGKNGVMVPETNTSEYMAKLVVACIVFPNLNDAELQKSYGARGADVVVRKMLLSGEYGNLVVKVQQINGFDKDINDLAEEVKN